MPSATSSRCFELLLGSIVNCSVHELFYLLCFYKKKITFFVVGYIAAEHTRHFVVGNILLFQSIVLGAPINRTCASQC